MEIVLSQTAKEQHITEIAGKIIKEYGLELERYSGDGWFFAVSVEVIPYKILCYKGGTRNLTRLVEVFCYRDSVKITSYSEKYDELAAKIASAITKVVPSDRIVLEVYGLSMVKQQEPKDFCSYCGRASTKNAKNCEHCGAPLSVSS